MSDNKYVKTFKLLLPYLWLKERKDLKTRVVLAIIRISSEGDAIRARVVGCPTLTSKKINPFVL